MQSITTTIIRRPKEGKAPTPLSASMDDLYSPLSPLELACFYQDMGVEELKQALMYATLEVETTRIAAQEGLERLEDRAIQIEQMLDSVARERDEARETYNSLLLHHRTEPQRVEECEVGECKNNNSHSESQESVVSLPEKGRLLEAVMNAGPLLQTLMLAGPLPRWRVPPPPLQSFEIPPVNIKGNGNGNDCCKRCPSL